MEFLTNKEDGIAEFAVFKSPLQGTITIRADSADRVNGLLVQFIGRKIENKNEVVHLTLWSNINRRKKFKRFAACRLADFTTQKPNDTKLFAFDANDFDRVLGVFLAPLTEIYTGQAKVASYAANVRQHCHQLRLGGAKAALGYRESVVLEAVDDDVPDDNDANDAGASPTPEPPAVPAVMLLVGWEGFQDSRKVLRKGCSSATTHHIQFSELVPALDPEESFNEEDEHESISPKQEDEPEMKSEIKT
ncbi:hypothetical protein SCUCBS95973_004010 [Sporothrix curviconia]|uniref:Uncharacterized protein n=1 Tax=Sporothrix curviconia TaxID=1260050 RepID=A0ABP0BKH0_9PEZI